MKHIDETRRTSAANERLVKVALVLLNLAMFGLLAIAAMAQSRRDYNLERDYGLSAMQGNLLVRHVAADTNAAKAKYPRFAERLRLQGRTAAWLMNVNVMPAAWNDAVLQGQGGGQPLNGRVTSNNGVTAPDGDYSVNYPCFADGGEYIGQGTGYAGNNPPTASSKSMNTCLRLNRSPWLGTEFDQMNLIQSSTWGMLSGSNSYTESGMISGFLLIGDNPGWHDASYMSSGLGLWDVGETYKVDDIYARDFNGYGITIARGTPATIDVISAFTNSVGGIAIIGGALNTYRFGTVSGDDNPSLFHVRPGYGREGGGSIHVALVKSESGKRVPNKGQIVMDAVGYTRATFGNVWVAVDYERVDALFVMDNRGMGSSVTVMNLDGYGYSTVVQDVTNKKRWASPGDYAPCMFRWDSRNGGTLAAWGATLTQGTHSCTSRLGRSIYANGAWTAYNYTACTPAYAQGTPTTPPPTPTPCTYTYSTWSDCTGGKRARTVTSATPSGCTGTPLLEEACTVEPPPTGGVIASYSNFSNTSSTASTPVTWANVKRVKFTNVKVEKKESRRLIYAVNDNNGLRLHDDGRWRAPNNKVCQSTPSVWQVGVTYATAEIVVPDAFNAAYWLAKPPAGSALLFSADRVEILNQ